MSVIYPKNLKEVEKLSAFFGQAYGKQLELLIAREPQYTYMAYLTQTDTNAPVPQVLFSNFDVDPTFAYKDVGVYQAFHPQIDALKSIVTISSGQVSSPDAVRAVSFVMQPGEIRIGTVDNMANGLDDQLTNTMFKLEIWL